MSRSFLVDSLIDKDSHTKPKSVPPPVGLIPPFFASPRYPYQQPSLTDYILSMGRLPYNGDKKLVLPSRSIDGNNGKLEEQNLDSPSNFLFHNFYQKDSYQPFCCNVSPTPHPHLPPSKSKVFRPIPVSSKKKLEDIKTEENLLPQPEGIKISSKGNYSFM